MTTDSPAPTSTTGAPARAAIDRNLALELVRATEAAALAASRHLGRGDKEIVDQAAVDAMRPVLNTISMRGTVVIGEGEKDEAPDALQRRGRRRRHRAGGRLRRRPRRRHHADRQEPAERAGDRRGLRAAHDVRPGPLRLHGEDRRQRRPRRRHRLQRPHRDHARPHREGPRRPGPGAHGVHPRPPTPRGGPRPAGPRGGLPDQVPARRRRRRGDHGRDPGHQRRPHGRHRRHPRGRARRVRAQVPGRRLLRHGSTPATTTSAASPWTPATTSTRS